MAGVMTVWEVLMAAGATLSLGMADAVQVDMVMFLG